MLWLKNLLPYRRFQSTPPARGATIGRKKKLINGNISIHAPREGGDYVFAPGPASFSDFNPRPPRGGRRLFFHDLTGHEMISIHAPREGGDLVPFAFRKFL